MVNAVNLYKDSMISGIKKLRRTSFLRNVFFIQTAETLCRSAGKMASMPLLFSLRSSRVLHDTESTACIGCLVVIV